MSSISNDVFRTEDIDQWNKVLDEIGIYDFYHTPYYHRLAEMREECDAYMVVFREDGYTIAMPVLLRDIILSGETHSEQGLKDATSVYGYVGPIASSFKAPEKIRKHFLDHLQEFYKLNGVVSAFMRMHPLLDQSFLLEGSGEITNTGFTTSIDLTIPQEDQVAGYRRNHRYEIDRLKKSNLHCEEVNMDYLDDFERIYIQTMHDLNADPSYFFDKPYFEYLMHEMSGIMHLFICKDNETVACAALFALCNGIIQYHLAGTVSEYRKQAPMKLILDTARNWGNEIGAKALHLGGGVGAQRDSLFRFKTGFGGQEHSYLTWRLVVNQAVYNELCYKVSNCKNVVSGCNYFPMYRDLSLCDATQEAPDESK